MKHRFVLPIIRFLFADKLRRCPRNGRRYGCLERAASAIGKSSATTTAQCFNPRFTYPFSKTPASNRVTLPSETLQRFFRCDLLHGIPSALRLCCRLISSVVRPFSEHLWFLLHLRLLPFPKVATLQGAVHHQFHPPENCRELLQSVPATH